jgi:hypothetical protein
MAACVAMIAGAFNAHRQGDPSKGVREIVAVMGGRRMPVTYIKDADLSDPFAYPPFGMTDEQMRGPFVHVDLARDLFIQSPIDDAAMRAVEGGHDADGIA